MRWLLAGRRARGDDEKGGAAVMVVLFVVCVGLPLMWLVTVTAGREITRQRLQNVADSLALAGAAMVLEQGANGDQVRNWPQLEATVGRPTAEGQPFRSRPRVFRSKQAKIERRVVEVTVEGDHQSPFGTRHFKVVSYAYVWEKLYTDEWPVLVLILDATGSMNPLGGQGSRGGRGADLWGRLKEVVKSFLGMGMPVRTGAITFNEYVASWVRPDGEAGGHVAHFAEPPKEKFLWIFDDPTGPNDCRVDVSSSKTDAQLCQEAMGNTSATKTQIAAKAHQGSAGGAGAGKSGSGLKKPETIRCPTHQQAILAAMHYVHPDNKTNVKLPIERAAEMLRSYVASSKRAVIISDGEPNEGGSDFSWVPFLGLVGHEDAAVEAGLVLRKLPSEGTGLFAIETARVQRKTKFLIALAGPPLTSENEKITSPTCKRNGQDQYPFYKQVSSMSDVPASLVRLAQAICTYGPLQMKEGDPVAVYLETPQGDSKLELDTDYELCAGYVQLNTEKCRLIGTNADHRLVIRWGRPRLTPPPPTL